MEFDSTDIFECAHFDVTDELLSHAMIAAYMFNQQVDSNSQEKPYTPKNFPDKAIDLMIPVSDDFLVEVYFDTNLNKWDSKFNLNGTPGKLSPDQMGQFFKSNCYKTIVRGIQKKWPLSDPTYAKLFDAVTRNSIAVGPCDSPMVDIISTEWDLTEVDQARKRTDLANKDVTGDGERDYTGSGRKIIHFDDQGVKTNSAEFYCWPHPDPKMTFKWSQWKDWTRIKPFAKMTFVYNSRKYLITLSLFDEMFDERGFRGADLTWTPPLAWLTPTECDDIMKLSITRKFISKCISRINEYLSYTPAEVYEKINNKDKITIKEIEKTQRVIKHVLDSAIRKHQADSYCWK